jgi:hypothetical protein
MSRLADMAVPARLPWLVDLSTTNRPDQKEKVNIAFRRLRTRQPDPTSPSLGRADSYGTITSDLVSRAQVFPTPKSHRSVFFPATRR